MFSISNSKFKFESVDELFAFFKVSSKNKYILTQNKRIRVNDVIIKNSSCPLNKEDYIDIDDSILMKEKYIPYDYKLKVLYEDNDILIVYKPISMLVHPDGLRSDTLMNAVSNYYKNSNNYFTHLHRLDYETSGMIVIAKNIFSASFISNEWENKKVVKEYICLCEGYFGKKEDIIKYDIKSDRHTNNKQVVIKSKIVDNIKTYYKVLEAKNNISKLIVRIDGGKKHQIRAHLSSIMHPIIGDKIYGNNNNKRMMLEFYHIEFIHPTAQTLFTFEIDKEF